MRVLRGSVILGAAVVGALLIGPVAWADQPSDGTSSAPAASGPPGSGIPAPPETTPPETAPPDTTAPATTSPATSAPAPPTATSQPPSPTATPSGTPPPGGVTGTAVADCSSEQVVFTVVNRTGRAVTAGIAVPGGNTFRTFVVPAGEQRVVQESPGAGPFQYVLQRLNPTRVLATVDGFFSCPSRTDLSLSATSGQPATLSDVCVVAVFLAGGGPVHGQVTVTEDDKGLVYTSDAGYVGPDQFDYDCLTSEGVFGTVFVQVHPVAATTRPGQPTSQPTQSVQPVEPVEPVQPTQAPPSAGALASTGSDVSGVALAGAALVLAGGLLLGALALTRRRS